VAFTILWGQALAGHTARVGTGWGYNSFWQATVWDVWQIGLVAWAGVTVVRSRPEGWGMFFASLMLLLLGALAQWIFPAVVPHLPVWERLASLVAYPLIAVAVYQYIVAGLRVHSRELQDISQASLDQIKSLLYLFEASQQTSSSLDLSTVLDNAVRGIARVLDADQCAIAFPEVGNANQMRLVAIYNPTRQGRGEAVAFPLEYQLTVQQAIRRRKHVIVEESENVQLKVLFALLGSGETGPLLVQPLLSDRATADGEASGAIGAVIVGNSRSRKPFSAAEAKLCQSLAEQLVVAIQNARRYQATQDRILELTKAQSEDQRSLQQAKAQIQELADRLAKSQAEIDEIKQREEAAREARNALEIRLVSSRAEADTLSSRLTVLETDLAQTHANAEAQLRWHEKELARQQAEWETATQVAELVQGVLQGMTAGILVTDGQGMIHESNVAAEILLEHSREELQGLPLEALSEDERWQQAVATAAGGEAVRLTLQIGINTLMCDVTPLPDLEAPARTEGEPELQRLVVIMQDISAEIEEQRNRLETIASTAEELRNPITTIISYTDLILSEAVGLVGEAQRKFLLSIKAGAERLVQLANDLAQHGGGEEGWTKPQPQMVDINELIEAAVAGSHTHLEDKELTLDLSLPEDLPAIKADPDYLRRVLSNLLSNACLASAVGGQIQVQTVQSSAPLFERDDLTLNGDDFVIVSVKDSGGGLLDEALDRVFDRARPSRTPPGLGESGAGLALVKTLVEAHGGRLWIETERGVGTTFSFVLPVGNSGELAGSQGEAVAG
jgi:signal transduction histidine kinase